MRLKTDQSKRLRQMWAKLTIYARRWSECSSIQSLIDMNSSIESIFPLYIIHAVSPSARRRPSASTASWPMAHPRRFVCTYYNDIQHRSANIANFACNHALLVNGHGTHTNTLRRQLLQPDGQRGPMAAMEKKSISFYLCLAHSAETRLLARSVFNFSFLFVLSSVRLCVCAEIGWRYVLCAVR